MSNLTTLQRKSRERRAAANAAWLASVDRNGTHEPLALLAKVIREGLERKAGQFGYQDARDSHGVFCLRDVHRLQADVRWATRTDEVDHTFETFCFFMDTIDRAYRDAYIEALEDFFPDCEFFQ
jgi:hypothetical protein